MSDETEDSESLNPYAATSSLNPQIASPKSEERHYSLGKSVLTWSIVCSVSAAPSFFIALGFVGTGNWPWMLLGIVVFIAAYVAADGLTFHWPFRARKAVKLSLFITYIIRVAASIVFPVALFADMFCGMVSSQVVRILGHNPISSKSLEGPLVLIWTLSQGVVMNAVLAIIWVILLGICWLVTSEPLHSELPNEFD